MYKYFYYSSEQLKLRVELEKKRGRNFIVGHIIVNGVKKPFTELTTKDSSRYPDAKLVAEGEVETMRYTEPEAI